jgi:hypothetical protein
MPGLKRHVTLRFWSKVLTGLGPNDTCWLWTGFRNTVHGYGQFDWRFEHRAHRAAWRLTHGTIPEGMSVLHKCDNKLCVRPDHLFLGDQKTNVRDCVAKGRISRGEHRPQHKLTEGQIREIRQRYVARTGTYRGMAKEYGVQACYIWKIVKRTAWRHVE